MSNLEIILCVILGTTILALIRLYRKNLIIRHLFIDFADWSSLQIDEIEQEALQSIVTIIQDIRPIDYENYEKALEFARGNSPFSVLDAKIKWKGRFNWLQDMLKHNRCKPLDLNDKDMPAFLPWISGIAYLPHPNWNIVKRTWE